MLRKIRILLAAFTLIVMTLLFLDFTGTIHLWLGWMAKIQFLPALLAVNAGVVAALVFLTLLFGRIYCSVICPLGILQDVISWFARGGRKNFFRFQKPHTALRFGFLFLFVVLLAAGLGQIAAWIAPYSTFGRIIGTLLNPIYAWGNNWLAYLAERVDSYAFYRVDVWIKGSVSFLISLLVLMILGFCAGNHGRLWCNAVCPVGTLLGLVSRFAIFKPVFDLEKCNGCGLCARNCKAECIDPMLHQIDLSRCVACYDCVESCRQKALTIGLYDVKKTQDPKETKQETGNE